MASSDVSRTVPLSLKPRTMPSPAPGPSPPAGGTYYDNHGPMGNMNIGPNGTINVTAPTPRRLTQEQINAIGHALGRYRGMRVNLVRYSSAGQEGADLANDILEALTLAKMQVSNEIGAEYNDTRTGRPIPGLLVEIGPRDPVPGQMERRRGARARFAPGSTGSVRPPTEGCRKNAKWVPDPGRGPTAV
jgi:hypothetical protein